MSSKTVPSSSTEFNALSGGVQPQFRVSMTLAVTDAAALWTAAAARLLGAPGMVFEDVIAVLGPCEDPVLGACIATLAKPDGIAGCLLDDFWIDAFPSMPPRLDGVTNAGDARTDGGERPVRRLPTRRTSAPALHLLINTEAPRTRLG
ncbi:hypothetical protein AB5I39_13300 [Sphingomonas sp. MMS24-J45]|uniref:hypothetical protein n=1 Tax=Sphingomonas sp. MMS24-J45 TaxID=3238806 RepID=UPI00385087C9